MANEAISEQFELRPSYIDLQSQKKLESGNFESESSVRQNTNSIDLQTDGAVSVEPSGSLMLGHGTTMALLNDETHNQIAPDWEPVEGLEAEQVDRRELNEQLDFDYRVEKSEKFTMKNGCCRECMKAFSKNGKVSERYSHMMYFRVVFAKFHDFKEEPHYL